ncbi:MAG TPA: hypothetical protein VFQ12_04570 [Thermoleophilaceae bacterium]|nr:hypothetical protein [Thermoleophilaceae bacterium]
MIRRCLICLIPLALAAPASAAPVSEKVTSGNVTAELTYERDGDDYSDFHVKIERDGAVMVDRAVRSGCSDEPCGVVPAGRAAKDDSVVLRDLDADREPEVIVDLFTGGAHCCTVSTIYSFVEGAGYSRLRRNWRDAGYRLRDLKGDGKLEFRTGDARFGYLYSSYAESYLPVRILRFSARRGLVDVSRSHRRWLRADARRALRLYRRVRDRAVNVRGILAAYAADLYRLGERRAARRTLFRALRRGDLEKRYELDFGPVGRAYIRRLDRFLRKSGYTARG